MQKFWTKSQLNRIYRDHPELKPLPVKSLDTVVIEFLKLHEVEVMPPKNSRAGGAIAGAITGAFGPDVGGDAFLIQGQNKQTKLQEWTSWKQWALSHKDFPEFKKKVTGGAVEKNEESVRKLIEPEFVKKWTAYFKEFEAKEYARKTKENKSRGLSLLALVVIFGGVIGAANSPELKRYFRNRELNEMMEYIKKNKGDKPIIKIDPESFNNEKISGSNNSVKINCNSPVWKKKPICN